MSVNIFKKFVSIYFIFTLIILSYSNRLQAQQHHGNQHSFTEAEKWINLFEDPEREKWQKPEQVVQTLHLKEGDKVADIGAGSGYFSRRFAQVLGKNGIVYAIDIEPGMLKYIQQRAEKENLDNIVTVLAATNNPMLAPNSVDLVFICDTIHHISKRKDYYQILYRILKSHGRLVIVDFIKKENTPVGPPIAMRIKKEDLVHEITSTGFNLQEEFNLLPYQYFLVFRKEQQEDR